MPGTPTLPTVNAAQLTKNFRDECIILARLPNGTVHPVLHPPQQRTQHAPGIRIFDNAEAAIVEMGQGRLASLQCAVVPLKDLFD